MLLSDAVYNGNLAAGRCIRPRTDHSLECQRGLRALLESALADVTLRRLRAVSYGDAANAMGSAWAAR